MICLGLFWNSLTMQRKTCLSFVTHAATMIGDGPMTILLSFGDICTPAGVLGGDVLQPLDSEPSLSTDER